MGNTDVDGISMVSNAERPESFVERLIGRSLSDIRIHKDRRAGDLAGRLGARAFTIGRDVYVKPELGDSTTPEGAALLAHELSHVVEQAGGHSMSMPLLNGRGAQSQANGAAPAVQRVPDDPGESSGSPASLPVLETQAERVERAVLRSAAAGPVRAGSGGGTEPDVEAIAERVYRLLAEEIVLDRERGSFLY